MRKQPWCTPAWASGLPSRPGRGVRWVVAHLCWAMLVCVGQAWAGWQAVTSGESGFNAPAAYANLRTVDMDSTSLAGEGARISYSKTTGSAGFLTSAGSVSYAGSGPALSGFSGNAVVMNSGSNGAPASFTIQFNGGGTSYVAMLIGMSVKEDNTQYIRFTYGSGTQVTLYNCKSASNANCLASYVPSHWLLDLISGVLGILFGNNSYDSVYLTYVPPAGESITKVEVFDDNCPSCAGLLASSAQSMWVDNISYVDPTVGPHHLEVSTTSATVSSGMAVTFTIRACANADCSNLYTTGLSGTLAVSGAGVTTTYPGGSTYTIPARSAQTTLTASMTPAGTVTVALSAPSRTPSSTPAVWCGMGTAATSTGSCTLTVTTPLHHVELLSNANTTVTCVPLTFTVKACADASCATAYTSGVSGTLTVSGSNVTSYSQAFTVPNGSGSVTLSNAHMGVATGAHSATATASVSGLSVTPTAGVPVYYGLGAASGTSGGSQTLTLQRAGFVFDVKHHVAEATQAVAVTALKTADNSNACAPYYVNADAVVNFTCSHTNPGTGTMPVRIQDTAIAASYQALNASNNSAAACDASGANVTLRFNASGVASIHLKYADVGAMALVASVTANGVTAITGNDSFTTAPHDFGVSVTTAGSIKAGNAFAATVSARNAAGSVTPNFGRETPPEGVTLGAVRTSPRFVGATTGTLTGAMGAFIAGVASASTLAYSEVGKMDLSARLTSGSYLGTGKMAAGSTQGSWVSCASENGSCALPAGATAVVRYGASGLYNDLAGQSGTVACNNATFGDPIVGTAKGCSYQVYAGSNTGVSGQAGPFTPHHFTVTPSNACGGGFTYSGQPFLVVVKAHNASGALTVNYDGTDALATHNWARPVSLSDTAGATSGSWSNTLMQASAFSAGTGTTSGPAFTFTQKTTAPQSLTVRAMDSDGVSSMGYTEGAVLLRSGRLQFANAFGSERTHLIVPIQVQYWNGQAWARNVLDTGCTTIPAGAFARSNHVDARGVASTGTGAWTTIPAGNVSMTAGRANLTLQAPTWTHGGTGTVAGSVEVAVNLGTGSQDNACLGTHPSASPGGMPWLRAPQGSCSGLVDPSARMSFGVFSPETRKLIHIHDSY